MQHSRGLIVGWVIATVLSPAAARVVTFRAEMADIVLDDSGARTFFGPSGLESAALEFSLDVDDPGQHSSTSSVGWEWSILSGRLILDEFQFDLNLLINPKYQQERIPSVDGIGMFAARMYSPVAGATGTLTYSILGPEGVLFDEIERFEPPSSRHTAFPAKADFNFNFRNSVYDVDIDARIASISVVPSPASALLLVPIGCRRARRSSGGHV